MLSRVSIAHPRRVWPGPWRGNARKPGWDRGYWVRRRWLVVNLEDEPERASQLCRAAQERLLRRVQVVTDDEVRAGSLLLEWTVGHVLTHWPVMLMLTLGAWPVRFAGKMSPSTPAVSTNDVLRSMPEPPDEPMTSWSTSRSAWARSTRSLHSVRQQGGPTNISVVGGHMG